MGVRGGVVEGRYAARLVDERLGVLRPDLAALLGLDGTKARELLLRVRVRVRVRVRGRGRGRVGVRVRVRVRGKVRVRVRVRTEARELLLRLHDGVCLGVVRDAVDGVDGRDDQHLIWVRGLG